MCDPNPTLFDRLKQVAMRNGVVTQTQLTTVAEFARPLFNIAHTYTVSGVNDRRARNYVDSDQVNAVAGQLYPDEKLALVGHVSHSMRSGKPHESVLVFDLKSLQILHGKCTACERGKFVRHFFLNNICNRL